VRRTAGLTAKRAELDGFAGAMKRVRGAYDMMRQLSPVSDATDNVIDAMQAGDRMSYHPEHAVEEIAHFHEVLPKAQADVAGIQSGLAARIDEFIKRAKGNRWLPADFDFAGEAKRRLDAVAKAHSQVDDAGK